MTKVVVKMQIEFSSSGKDFLTSNLLVVYLQRKQFKLKKKMHNILMDHTSYILSNAINKDPFFKTSSKQSLNQAKEGIWTYTPKVLIYFLTGLA